VAAVAQPGTTAGNVYDKYNTNNPVARRLMRGFFAALDELVDEVAPVDLLEVGCGEGAVTEHLALRAGAPGRVVGLDLDVPALHAAWERRAGATFVTGDAHALPFDDDTFDAVALIESLQLIADPARALAEAARVARRVLLVTAPREPLWRILNVARGAYVRARGNTPGHLHHFSRAALVAALEPHGHVVDVRTPVPWTLALARLG
jgi:SAM-dependent methyltransferase